MPTAWHCLALLEAWHSRKATFSVVSRTLQQASPLYRHEGASMAAQQLWERVELGGEGELAKVKALLDEALERQLQVQQPERMADR